MYFAAYDQENDFQICKDACDANYFCCGFVVDIGRHWCWLVDHECDDKFVSGHVFHTYIRDSKCFVNQQP